MKISERFEQASHGAIVCLAAGMMLIIGLVDFLTGWELAFSIFYLVPVAIVIWYGSVRAGYVIVIVSAAIWHAADTLSGHTYSHHAIPYWNAVVRLGFFLIVAAILHSRKLAERKVREAAQLKTEFASVVSHELRTPMTVIKDGIQIVLDGTAGSLNEEQQDYLRTALRNVDRLARFINDVLDYQKLEAGRMQMRRDPEDLAAIVREIVEGMRSQAEKKQLTLELQLDDDLPPVACDRDRIIQVLVNFLNNAVKFTERGGLRVATERGENWVRVAVADDGPGIAPEDLPKLFQSFSQLSTGSSRKTGGTGLGLAICKQIIEQHGGRVGVESTPGRGSTFFFVLPIDDRRGRLPRPAGVR